MYLGEKEYSGSDPLQKCKHILNVCACVCACILIYADMGEVRKIFVVPFHENPFYKAETVETLTVSGTMNSHTSVLCDLCRDLGILICMLV